jgi:Undecaprenyl-phosphate galactose phosphotransferase WbaP
MEHAQGEIIMTGQSETYITARLDRSRSSFWFDIKRHRLLMGGITLGSDLLGFSAAGILLFGLNLWLELFKFQWSDLKYGGIVFMCLAWYMPTKLYPGIGLNPAEELRLVVTNTVIANLFGIYIFGLDGSWHANHLALIPLGLLSIVFVLAARWGIRIWSVKLSIWGAPVVVIGNGTEANKLARYFLNRRRLGFVPRYVVTDAKSESDVTSPVAILNREQLLTCRSGYFSKQHIHTALIDIAEATDILTSPLYEHLSHLFTRLIFVSNPVGMDSASFQIHDFEGISGIEVSRNVLSPMRAFIKRSMDIVLSLMLIILSFPLWALTMILIRLESPGPIFYTQERVGKYELFERRTQNSSRIRIYKFRTMIVDADKRLQRYLDMHPAAREEWERTQKLQDDPRITRVGKWVRRFSIDELPQLINVLKGEMSLVGPRPMMVDQISMYGKAIQTYCSVHPGLTGFWQVSGRNQTSFEERAAFDEYYIHNWSPWLDIYILLRTVWVVVRGDGAY